MDEYVCSYRVIETSVTSVMLEATLLCTKETSSRDTTRKLKVKSKQKEFCRLQQKGYS